VVAFQSFDTHCPRSRVINIYFAAILDLDIAADGDRAKIRHDRPIVDLQPSVRLDQHPEEVRFASDSPLEGSGFELPVPVRQAKLTRSCR
jgi:hypothetical protein